MINNSPEITHNEMTSTNSLDTPTSPNDNFDYPNDLDESLLNRHNDSDENVFLNKGKYDSNNEGIDVDKLQNEDNGHSTHEKEKVVKECVNQNEPISDEKNLVTSSIRFSQSKRGNWSFTKSVLGFKYDYTEAEYEERMSKYFTFSQIDDYFRKSREISIPLENKRARIANEIMTSEQSYNHYIKVLINVWRNPLLAAAKDGAISVNEATVNKIFGVILSIEGVSDILLENFQNRLSDWSSQQTMGDLFIEYGDLLKTYTDYSKDRYNSKKCLDECLTRGSFQAFLKVCRRQPLNNNRLLWDYLIMPIQRVPRYELLLVDLMKHTPLNHPDTEYLGKSISKIKLIAEQIDKSVEEYKMFDQIIQIQKKLSGSLRLLQPGRRLVKEGILVKTCRKAQKSRMFWLFNDLLLYAIPTLGMYTLRAQIPMYTVELEDIPDDEESGGKKYCFVVKNKVKSFEVCASSKMEKYDWLVALNIYASESFKSRVSIVRNQEDVITGGQAPVWVPDSLSNYCELCSFEFNIIIRKHHCRVCGKIVCSTCSSRKVAIPHLNKGNSRICDVCYDKNYQLNLKKENETTLEVKKDGECENVIDSSEKDSNDPSSSSL